MPVRTCSSACVVVLVVALTSTVALAAQGDVTLTGRLLDSLSRAPIVGGIVVLEEPRREATSGADGRFTFENVPPGRYHLFVRLSGFSARRTEVTVGADAAPLEVLVEPDLHFEEVVSVSAQVRSQFEAFQPTSVLTGQDLTKQLEMSIGATLESQPGVASRSFGPAPARPVIRGLDGDRVQILQDGQRMGDLSSQSGDHGVTVNPASAQRIEVVRGPATLLYGANAIGGLVNVITEDIPTRPMEGASGNVTLDLGSAAKEAAGAADVRVGNGLFALHAGGGGRRSGDVDTPEGEVDNSQSRNGFGTLGLSWTGTRGYFGGSYGYDDTKYGIPVVEGGILQLTPRRHSFSLRGGGEGLDGAFDAFRATLALRRYRHDELEGDEVGTAFRNDTTEVELMGSHRALGRLKGSVGGWVLDRAFDARGAEALSPAVDQRGFAAFLYEEVTWPHLTFQFGARLDNVRYEPAGEPEREFTNGSGSVGLLFRPAAADDRLTVAASLARAARAPALEELFFFGQHHGNFAIELGNPDLEPEHALGFDLSLRWRGSRASGEVTYFRNDVDQFIFRQELDHEQFEAREEEFAARFPGRALAGEEHEEGAGEEEELAIVDFVGADAVLQGVEAHADFSVTPRIFVELGLDYVRGTQKGNDRPLPRIPPLRVRGGVRYQYSAFQAGGEVVGTARQNRVVGAEDATDGYALLKLFASYSFVTGGATSTLTARLDNVTDELFRNHLSLIKNVVPEMGRNVKLLYNVSF
ncbi:MAG: TonB-dependent receptor [Acidobacteria bacterium]|nr:TonB-dependent receptor [Acidobacteriota bacterium]